MPGYHDDHHGGDYDLDDYHGDHDEDDLAEDNLNGGYDHNYDEGGGYNALAVVTMIISIL